MYVPVTGNVNTSWNPVAADPRTAPPRTTTARVAHRQIDPIRNVLPDTDIVSFCPAVPANVRTAFSPIVVVVTVVADPIAVVPVLSGTAANKNVTVPVC